MLTYRQSTGTLKADDGTLIGIGFSGIETMRNKPECENILHGPIPKQHWAIGVPRKRDDSWVMRLTPLDRAVPRTKYGTFSIQTGPISQGCIVLPKEAVAKVVELWNKRECTLQVTD